MQEGLAPKIFSVAWFVLHGTCKQYLQVWEVGEKVQLQFAFSLKGLHTDNKIQATGIAASRLDPTHNSTR